MFQGTIFYIARKLSRDNCVVVEPHTLQKKEGGHLRHGPVYFVHINFSVVNFCNELMIYEVRVEKTAVFYLVV